LAVRVCGTQPIMAELCAAGAARAPSPRTVPSEPSRRSSSPWHVAGRSVVYGSDAAPARDKGGLSPESLRSTPAVLRERRVVEGVRHCVELSTTPASDRFGSPRVTALSGLGPQRNRRRAGDGSALLIVPASLALLVTPHERKRTASQPSTPSARVPVANTPATEGTCVYAHATAQRRYLPT
jgi:hypothetical protein